MKVIYVAVLFFGVSAFFSPTSASRKETACKTSLKELRDLVDPLLARSHKELHRHSIELDSTEAKVTNEILIDIQIKLDPLQSELNELKERSKKEGKYSCKCRKIIKNFLKIPQMQHNSSGCVIKEVARAKIYIQASLNRFEDIELTINRFEDDIKKCSREKKFFTRAECFTRQLGKINRTKKQNETSTLIEAALHVGKDAAIGAGRNMKECRKKYVKEVFDLAHLTVDEFKSNCIADISIIT